VEWQNGIDTVAHKATLEAKGNTIAVLPNGFDNIYPKQNIDLFNEIIQNGGLVVSEYSPNEVACSYKFLERNRIVSGLSLGVLVIEAKYRSGTSVTAKIAKSQGRKVFAIPHEIWEKNGVGTNRLIKEGAIIVTETRDIIEQFRNLEYKEIDNKQSNTKRETKIDKKTDTNIDTNIDTKKNVKRNTKRNTKISIKTDKNVQESRSFKIEKIENKDYQQICRIIDNQIYSIDEICKITKRNIREVQQILLMMEIEGYVKRTGGGYICT